MNKFSFILIFLFTTLSFAGAQTQKAYQKAVANAEASKNYPEALAYYRIIIEETGDEDVNNYYKAAQIARKFRVYETAERYYRKVAESEAKAQYPLNDYWLGMVLKSQSKYDEAIGIFERYIAGNNSVDEEYVKKAQKEINDCNWARELMAEADDIDIIHLDSSINTADTELRPIGQGDKFYYSSFGQPGQSVQEEDTWAHLLVTPEGKSTQLLGAPFNMPGKHVTNASFSPDGQRMYFNVCASVNMTEVRCDIYYSDQKANDKWSDPVRMPDYINLSGYTATQPTVDKDPVSGDTYLFFASDRPEGKGNLDIWCSVMGEDGSFSHPVNIAVFNTPEDDITPFFHGRSQSLYFSSNGFQNMGGHDVYRSRKQGKEWGSPQHLGYPVNGSYDDIYYSVDSENGKNYFASNRPGAICADTTLECTTCNDLYVYDAIEINLLALTYNSINKKDLLGCDVRLIDMTTGLEVEQVSASGNGTRYLLEPDKEYKVTETKEKYSSDEVRFDTYGITKSAAIEKRLYLTPKVDLIALTYDKRNNEELTGCRVELFNVTLNRVDTFAMVATAHRYEFPLEIGYIYKVRATKSNYSEDMKEFSTKDITEPTTITKKLYLAPATLAGFLPLPLYFDNDHPNPNTRQDVSNLNYEQTYNAYYPKKAEFQQMAIDGEVGIGNFFENDVRKGYETLIKFSDALVYYLKEGNKIEIVFRGYASPLAPSSYNEHLTSRRIDCVENFFRQYANGALVPYMDGTNGGVTLVVSEDPRGERTPKRQGISDKRSKPKESIYSVSASEERRVEIIRVEVNKMGYQE